MSILEILEAHGAADWNEQGRRECTCGHQFTLGYSQATHRAHVAQVLEQHEREQVAHERAHTIQMIRDQADHTPDQTGDYGRVELAGYLTIGTRELEKIEGDTGFDRMCFSVTGWEMREGQVRAEARAEAAAAIADAFQFGAWCELFQGNLQARLNLAQPVNDWLRARAAQLKATS